MDEKEKDLASSVFKVCRALERVSGAYFRGEINRPAFLKLFNTNLALLNDYYEVFKE